MDKTPKKYESLVEMPPKLLAGNVVGSLIKAKGSINMWQEILEHLVSTLTKEVIAHVTPQIRAAAIEDARILCEDSDNIESHTDSYYAQLGDASATRHHCAEQIRALAPLPPGHVCVPTKLLQRTLDDCRTFGVDSTTLMEIESLLAAAKEPK